jgi:uncharacterized protein YigE (DUF2233 family)
MPRVLMGLRMFLALLMAGWSLPLAALEAERLVHDGKRYTICRVNLEEDNLRLYWKSSDGEIYRNFARLKKDLERDQRVLEFATNAGMYQEDRKPLGLCVVDSRPVYPINLRRGRGNFYLQPGIFVVDNDGARIVGRHEYENSRITPRLATQSGPLLLLDGKIHPIFEKNSDSRKFRNGVGLRSEQKVVFAISDEPVNFYEFAALFKDRLECRDALFLDGTISKMYIRSLGRNDLGGNFGPILAIGSDPD